MSHRTRRLLKPSQEVHGRILRLPKRLSNAPAFATASAPAGTQCVPNFFSSQHQLFDSLRFTSKARAIGFNICFNNRSILLNSDVETVYMLSY